MKIHQYIFAMVTGVLVCFSFPAIFFGWQVPNLGWLGWIALVPLLVAIHQVNWRQAFILTFISALVWYAGSLYWVYNALHNYGGLSSLTSVLVTILMIVVLAAYIAVVPLLAKWIDASFHIEPIVILPVLWVAVEYSRNYFPFNGFPWANLAMSQYHYLTVLQIVDLVGISGLIFGLVLVNTFLAELFLKIRGEDVKKIIQKTAVVIILIGVIFGYGWYRLKTLPAQLQAKDNIKVGLIQGNISQADKWKEAKAEDILNIYGQGARELNKGNLDLIVWPEAAFPGILEEDIYYLHPSRLGTQNKTESFPYTLLGAVSQTKSGANANSAFLFDAQGVSNGLYHKTHLVPFGEYVPLEKILFFAGKLTEQVGDFIEGQSFKPLSFNNWKVGILICYEDIFPEISRKTVQEGAQFLANITNDAWYDISSAAHQHLALSVFRAVETRRYLLRSTNTGVSAVIDPLGRIMNQTSLFVPTLVVSTILPLNYISTYVDLGDWFAWGCVAYGLVMILMAIFWRVRKYRQS
ncbi:MAG: apolipoprotein N-acyltransferase [Pseudomonadota bacterium]